MEKETNSQTNSIPKITKISTQKRKGRYNVFLDDEYAFPVGEGVLIRHALHKGMEIPADLQKQLEEEDVYTKAYNRALSYLSYQLRSQKEITDDLIKHEFTMETAQEVIEKLAEMKYVDDLEYAKSYTRTVANLNGKGPYVIRQELKKRGIKEEWIEEALEEYPMEQRIDNGIELAKKVLRRTKNNSTRETQNKVRQNLSQKGFNGDEITEILNEIEIKKDDEEEYNALVKQGDKLWRKQSKLTGKKKRQKVKSGLYQKGYPGELINRYMTEKEMDEEE